MRILPIVCAGLVMLSFACKDGKKNKIKEQPETSVAIAKDAPKSLYEDLEGKPVQLTDFKGKRVLLNYWATWCKPCIEEMPVLERLQTTLSLEDYVFLFASDQSVKVIDKFKENKGFDLTFIKFNGNWADKDISALPATVIYGRAGEQVARFDGVMDWDSPEMIQKLKELQ